MRKCILILFLIIIFGCQKIQEEKEGVVFKGQYKTEDINFFIEFFKDMQKAAETKDLEKSLQFYSKDFKSGEGIDLNKIRENTKYLYQNYNNISYKMKDIKIQIQGDKAVSSDNFEYRAVPVKKGLKEINYKGREYIWWKKENGEWKIVNWLVE